MSLIRNDRQLALHDLLIAIQESADHFQDAAEFLGEHQVSVYFKQFAKQRLILAARLEEAIRAEGDLPPAPDPDKETSSIMFEHLLANLSTREAARIIEHRLDGEQDIRELVQSAIESGLDEPHPALVKDLRENNALILQSLQDLLTHSG